MTKQKISFIDSICISQPSIKTIKDTAFKMLDNDRQPQLRVQIDATHSGILTNLRVYPGKKVMDGHKSYTSRDHGGTAEYDKPVLKHHNQYDDPVGRIVGAKYTQLKNGQDFDLDFLSPDDSGKGSGFVTVDALINDPDTIKKILDGRFISVSAGHHTDMVICSVCGESIMACNHMPGRRYNEEGEKTDKEEGQLCYVITNKMTYDELSFVNVPAQPSAKLINFNWSDCKDLRDKENILITSMLASNKETVRTLVLTDSDDEVNLLTGLKKSDTKKTTIAVKPAVADKLKAALSLPDTDDDDSNVRPEGNEGKVEQPEQNLKANTQKINEDKTMDLNELQKKIEGLETKLKDAETTVKTSEEKVKAQEAQIQKLTEESKSLDTKMRKSLATTLASLKVRLKKPDAQNLDSQEKLGQYIDKLASRNLSSLEDAVSDLLIELEHSKEETTKTKSNTADLLAKDKVTSETIVKGDKPNQSKDKSKDKSDSTTVDQLDRVFDL